jgi:prepilin-type N-terminal cleavage/methylation domain-containing protein
MQGFTLIELMIVIAIIAIIAAIAIPNLLESRVSAQEAAAATALKSGLLPAEVQFQAGCYVNNENDGLGDYATATDPGIGNHESYKLMSGITPTLGGINLSLLSPAYQAAIPVISGYQFDDPVSAPAMYQRCWGVITQPVDQNQGRRLFAINQAGNIYASKPNITACSSTTLANDASLFGTSMVSAPNTANWVPYRR